MSNFDELIKQFGLLNKQAKEYFNKDYERVGETMTNFETEFYSWLAMKLGVKIGERFILKDTIGTRSFFCEIRLSGAYNAVTGDKLNGNTVNDILIGKLVKEALPWCPREGELFLEAYKDYSSKLHLALCSNPHNEVTMLAKLENGFIFPYTEDEEVRADYLRRAELKLKQLACKYGINIKG